MASMFELMNPGMRRHGNKKTVFRVGVARITEYRKLQIGIDLISSSFS